MVWLKAPQRDGDAGAIAVLVAIFAMAMFIFGALVVEVGAAREVRRDAQTAADAAALAAAGELYAGNVSTPRPSQAVAAAKRYAEENFDADSYNWASCDANIPPGFTRTINGYDSGTNCITFWRADPSQPWSKIQVVVPGKDTTDLLGAVSGDVRALAQAQIAEKSVYECVICVLGDYRSNGQADLDLNGFQMAIGDEVQQTGISTIRDASGIVVKPGETVSVDPMDTPVKEGDVIDPLASLTLPAWGQPISTAPLSGVCPQGAYFDVSGCTQFDVDGVYTVTRPTTFKGNDTTPPNIRATFFFTCDRRIGGVWRTVDCGGAHVGEAELSAAGNGKVILSGSGSGPYTGLAIIFDRELETTLTVGGNGSLVILNAGLYAKSASVIVDGGGNTGGLDFNGPVVVEDVTLNGGGSPGTVFAACSRIPNSCGSALTFPGPRLPAHLIK